MGTQTRFKRAGIAQLVEHQLPKLGVASSNLVFRSTLKAFIRKGFKPFWTEDFLFLVSNYFSLPTIFPT